MSTGNETIGYTWLVNLVIVVISIGLLIVCAFIIQNLNKCEGTEKEKEMISTYSSVLISAISANIGMNLAILISPDKCKKKLADRMQYFMILITGGCFYAGVYVSLNCKQLKTYGAVVAVSSLIQTLILIGWVARKRLGIMWRWATGQTVSAKENKLRKAQSMPTGSYELDDARDIAIAQAESELAIAIENEERRNAIEQNKKDEKHLEKLAKEEGKRQANLKLQEEKRILNMRRLEEDQLKFDEKKNREIERSNRKQLERKERMGRDQSYKTRQAQEVSRELNRLKEQKNMYLQRENKVQQEIDERHREEILARTNAKNTQRETEMLQKTSQQKNDDNYIRRLTGIYNRMQNDDQARQAEIKAHQAEIKARQAEIERQAKIVPRQGELINVQEKKQQKPKMPDWMKKFLGKNQEEENPHLPSKEEIELFNQKKAQDKINSETVVEILQERANKAKAEENARNYEQQSIWDSRNSGIAPPKEEESRLVPVQPQRQPQQQAIVQPQQQAIVQPQQQAIEQPQQQAIKQLQQKQALHNFERQQAIDNFQRHPQFYPNNEITEISGYIDDNKILVDTEDNPIPTQKRPFSERAQEIARKNPQILDDRIPKEAHKDFNWNMSFDSGITDEQIIKRREPQGQSQQNYNIQRDEGLFKHNFGS